MRQSLPKTLLLILTSLASFCFGVLIDTSHPFSSSAELETASLQHLNTSSLFLKDISISFSINELSDRITLLLELPESHHNWLGIGFHYLMHQGSGVAIEYYIIDNITYIDLFKYYSYNYSKPIRETEDDLELLSYSISNEGKSQNNIRSILFTVGFQPNDKNLISIATSDSPTIAFHGRRKNRFIVPLKSGIIKEMSDEVIVPNWLYKLHTSLLFFGWGYLADIGILTIRYLKGWKYYILLHQLIFLLLNVFTVAIGIALLIFNKTRINAMVYSDISLHHILSCFMLAIVIAQHALGFVLQQRIYKTDRQLTLPLLKTIHKYTGIFLYFLAKYIIYTGQWSSKILKNENKSHFASTAGLSLIFSLIIIGWIILESAHRQGRVQRYITKLIHIITQRFGCLRNQITKDDKKQLMQLLNSWESTETIKQTLPDMKYCLVGSKVYDLTDFLHPGGSYILSECNGREMQRFLNGQSHIEGIQSTKDLTNPPHSHSLAYLLYLKERFIGNIDYTNKNPLIIYSPETENNQENDKIDQVYQHEDNSSDQPVDILEKNNENQKSKELLRSKDMLASASQNSNQFQYLTQSELRKQSFQQGKGLEQQSSRSSRYMEGDSDYSFKNPEEEVSRVSVVKLKNEEINVPLLQDSASFMVVKKEKSVLFFKSGVCSVKNWLPGVSWFGLHYCIYVKGTKQQRNRLYTSAICLTQYNQRLRSFLANYLDILQSENPSQSYSYHQMNRTNSKSELLESLRHLSEWRVESVSDKLPFYVKKYRTKNALSRTMHENQQKIYRIEGPLGRGLELKDTFNEKIVIFANGTGVLPFLDLIFYELQRCAYKLAEERGQGNAFTAALGRDPNEFSYLQDTRIDLFLSCESVKLFVGKDIIQTLLRFQNAMYGTRFSLTLRLKDEKEFEQVEGMFQRTLSYFDARFIEALPVQTLSQASRIYISGSPDLTFSLADAFTLFPQYHQKIIYV